MSERNEKFVRQEDNPGAVLNKDQNGLLAYKRQKAKAINIEKMQADVNELRAQVCKNNDLLSKLIEKLSTQI